MSRSQYNKMVEDTLTRILHQSAVLRGQNYRVTRSYGDLPKGIFAVISGHVESRGAILDLSTVLTYPVGF